MPDVHTNKCLLNKNFNALIFYLFLLYRSDSKSGDSGNNLLQRYKGTEPEQTNIQLLKEGKLRVNPHHRTRSFALSAAALD